jgi:hypothetical protein
LGSRRQGALVRRRLAWILAQETGLAPDYHPDERKYTFATAVCAAISLAALLKKFTLVVQIFGPTTLLLGGLRMLHRRQRHKGLIHRWIPAGSAPEDALTLADWMVFVHDGGERGRPAPQFSEDYITGPKEKRLFEDARRRDLVTSRSVDGEGKLQLGKVGEQLMGEAKSRAAPIELTI